MRITLLDDQSRRSTDDDASGLSSLLTFSAMVLTIGDTGSTVEVLCRGLYLN